MRVVELIFAYFVVFFIFFRKAVHLSDFYFPDDVHNKPDQRVDKDDHARHDQYWHYFEMNPMQQWRNYYVRNDNNRTVR